MTLPRAVVGVLVVWGIAVLAGWRVDPAFTLGGIVHFLLIVALILGAIHQLGRG
ncbi:MAG: hypothetical protein R3326_08455 [Gemmatimonadota bacterium]|nr:hypothetical protein [Gemmatimonadota bacterium]